jgi:hypothetical protein
LRTDVLGAVKPLLVGEPASHELVEEPFAGTTTAARQLTVCGFPYLVAYRLRPDDIYVVAVAHAPPTPTIPHCGP